MRALYALCLLIASTATAFVLPAGSILRRLADARDDLHLSGLKVEGSLSFHGQATEEAGAALALAERLELQSDASILLKVPDRCRWEVVSAETGKALAVVSSRGKRRAEGSELSPLAVALEQLCPLLASRSSSDDEGRAKLEKHLEAMRVDLTATSLARFGGQVAYVIGKAGEGQPQLWVYKDTFLPARVRFSEADGTPWDVRLLDYTSPATGEWFPRKVEVYRGAELAVRFTGLRADARAQLPDKLF